MPHKELKPPSYEEVVGCQTAMFEWAESFDSKDWERLSRCVAPELYIDYRPIGFKMWEAMPAEEFLALSASKGFLGNIRIKTQHFIGASTWVKESDNKITGYHQARVAHQKYHDDELKEVAFQGHAHGKATTQYTLVDGVWKFSGLIPDIRWTEFDYDQIFTDY